MRKVFKHMSTAIFALVLLSLPSWAQDRPDEMPSSSHSYRAVNNWLQLPPGQALGTISWIDFDSTGRAYVFRRCPVACAHPKEGDPPGVVWMFDPDGKFAGQWGKGPIAKEAHSLRFDRDGFIWITDTGAHQVKKYNPDGTVVLTLGKYGVPGDGPDTFNMPTDVVVAKNGDVFISDGYGNQRVVKFDKDGHFIKSWGGKGAAPGQFRLPHSIVQDSRGRLLVTDRCGLSATGCTDNRIEIFDTDGKFLDQWKHMGGVSLYITKDDKLYVGIDGKLFIADALTGKVLDWIDKTDVVHGLAVDRNGDIFTAALGVGMHRYTRNSKPQ